MKRLGCLDCRLIEPEPGRWIDGRCPSCRKARGIKSSRIGRPKTRMRMTSECRKCGKRIEWLTSKPGQTKQFCSKKCNLAFQRDLRRKLPSGEELRTLYIKQNLSTPKIAEMFDTDASTVNKALVRAGVMLRKKTRVLQCQVRGCKNRAVKLRHPQNGSLYGTLCSFHRHEHREEIAHDYYLRTKQAKEKRVRELKGAA